MAKRLITIEDIKKYRPITADKARVEIYIDEAQINDLRPVLGDALYFDLLAKITSELDVMYENYVKLLTGTTYTYQSVSYTFDGIIPMLSYYTIARLRANPMEDTRFGTVTKTTEQSAPLTPEALSMAVAGVRAMAMSYQEKVQEFLDRHATIYTLYKGDTSQVHNRTGIKFFDPDSDGEIVNQRSI